MTSAAVLTLPAAPALAAADARLTALADGILYWTDRLNACGSDDEMQPCWERYHALTPELLATPADGVAGVFAKWRVFADWREGSEGGVIDDLADSIEADLRRILGVEAKGVA